MRRNTFSRSIEIGLHLIGIWPVSLCPLLYRLTWFVGMVIIQIFQYWYIIASVHSKDFSLLVDCMSTAFVTTLSILKLILIWLKKRTFYDVLSSMTTDWKQCSTNFHVNTMTNKASMSQRFSSMMIGVNSTAIILYELLNIIVPLNNKNIHSTPDRELLLKMKFPFEVDQRPIFEFMVIAAILHNVISATISTILDSFMISLIFHVSGQIDLMCHDLTETLSNNTIKKSTTITLRAAVIRHQKIIAFSNNIEDLFMYIALLQMIWNTLVICCLGFTIVVSFSSEQVISMVIKSLFFYIGMSLEAFVYCFAGEYLSAKSTSIGNVVYDVQWYEMKQYDCQLILLLIIRSQKQLTISAGKVMKLSMEGFANIMKATASYVSVLHAAYSK